MPKTKNNQTNMNKILEKNTYFEFNKNYYLPKTFSKVKIRHQLLIRKTIDLDLSKKVSNCHHKLSCLAQQTAAIFLKNIFYSSKQGFHSQYFCRTKGKIFLFLQVSFARKNNNLHNHSQKSFRAKLPYSPFAKLKFGNSAIRVLRNSAISYQNPKQIVK